jgi:hypothetical protein
MNSIENADCGRCAQQKEKVFRIEPNPSVAWGEANFPTPGAPPAIYSCKNCLTEDELAVLLAPAALYSIERLFQHRLADATAVMAVLRHRGQIMTRLDRESALALL